VNLIRIIAAAVIAAGPTVASAQPAAKPAAPGASAAADCGKSNRHDHGAERGTPRAKSANCADAGTPKKKNHDHGKVHKQQ
jgi:hypothetical protein